MAVLRLLCRILCAALWLAHSDVAAAQPAWGEDSFTFSRTDETDGEGNEGAAEIEAQDETPIEQDSEPEETTLAAVVRAGLGLGTRELRFPTAVGSATTDTGAYAAVELGLELAFAPAARRRYGLRGHYRTSAGLHVQEQRVAAAPRTFRARSQEVRGGVFAELALGDASWLGFGFEYAARNFSTTVPDAQTPSFTLSGPLLTCTLRWLALDGAFWVVLVPELQAIVQVGDELVERGAERVGIAGGGQLSLGVRLHGALGLEMAYYESRARVGKESANTTRDALRFVTLRLRGAL